MNLYNSSVYINDLDYVIRNCSWLKRFDGQSVFVTGSTGLICSAVADILLRYSELNPGAVNIYAAGRNEEKTRQRFNRYKDSENIHFVKYDASRTNAFNFDVDYIVHGASNASPSAIQAHPIDTMKDNFNGMLELLDYASAKDVKNTVFISTSEVYGRKDSLEPFREDEYGFIDVLNPRSSYSIGKKAAETLCASFAYEKHLPVSIIRPGHIYGPTASRSDNRVSSAFAYAAAEGNDLTLKSDGSQIRSYCYMLDCATAILKVLLDGGRSEAYNVSNPQSVMSIREIAGFYAEYGGVKLKFALPTEAEKAAFNPMQNSSLNSEKLQALGWKGLFDSKTGTEHTVKIIKECEMYSRLQR